MYIFTDQKQEDKFNKVKELRKGHTKENKKLIN